MKAFVTWGVIGWVGIYFGGRAFANESILLPSGNTIEVLSAGVVDTVKDGSRYVVKYQTGLHFDDPFELRHEGDEVWGRYAGEAGKARVTAAILTAVESPQWARESGPRMFDTIVKKAGEKWIFGPPDKLEEWPDKLTESIITKTLDHWDATTRDLNIDGMLLYLAPEWKLGMSRTVGDGQEHREMGLKELEQTSRSLATMLTDYKMVRENTKITVAPDGQTATVTSRITETMTSKDGRVATSIEDNSDVFELAHGRVVVKSSEQTMIEVK